MPSNNFTELRISAFSTCEKWLWSGYNSQTTTQVFMLSYLGENYPNSQRKNVAHPNYFVPHYVVDN